MSSAQLYFTHEKKTWLLAARQQSGVDPTKKYKTKNKNTAHFKTRCLTTRVIISALTAVNSDSQFELLVGYVPDLEVGNVLYHVQRHAGDFPGVLVAIANGKSWHHHVRITDCLHLKIQ